MRLILSNLVIWDYGVKLKRSDRSVYDKTTYWYCRANDTCVQQNVCYKMSTNSTSSASDHLKTYHHVVNNKVAMTLHQHGLTSDYGRGTEHILHLLLINDSCLDQSLSLHDDPLKNDDQDHVITLDMN